MSNTGAKRTHLRGERFFAREDVLAFKGPKAAAFGRLVPSAPSGHMVKELLCLQDNGYFKAAVKPSVEQLPDKRGTHQFVVTFDIDAGPQYRIGQIGFRNNRVFSAEELRSMFELASGDIFSPAKVRQGLDHMHSAYVERRYLNFTSVPDANIDDERHVISVVIDCDEGKQVR